MRAAVCYDFASPLVIADVELEGPRSDEVCVELVACAICHSDILYMDGAWGGALPSVLGHEAAGVVREVGADVRGMAPGDHVIVTLIRACGECFYCGHGETYLCDGEFSRDAASPLREQGGRPLLQGLRTGAFAEQVTVHHSQLAALPKDMALDSASLLACGVLTGFGAVANTAAMKPGSSAVIVGLGGVGLNSVQAAAILGANPIIGVDLAAHKLDIAPQFGATHALNPQQIDVVERIKYLTEGRGADFAFVTVGSKHAVDQGLAVLRPGGTAVIVGMPASGVLNTFEPGELAGNAQRVLGSKMGSGNLRVDIPKLIDLYYRKQLKLDELISGRYPLERINEAIQSVRDGEALRNVVVFER